MKKLGVVVLVAAGLVGASAQSASAAAEVTGPCETQQALFETANVEMPPTHPAAGTAYRAVCRVTG